jgi:N-acetylmuramoyl-L-alanine amidase
VGLILAFLMTVLASLSRTPREAAKGESRLRSTKTAPRGRRRCRASTGPGALTGRWWCSIPAMAAAIPGATSSYNKRQEKDVTLAIAFAIRDALAASGRVRVAMTREDDRFIVLRERYEIARRMKAGLFVSIHADAAPANDGARGATIYTLSEVASDREAAELAEQQNDSDRIGGAPLSEDAAVNRILIDLAQRESMNVSADFAALLRREASPFFPFRPEYHRFAALAVLKAPDVPSILFETGYLTNPVDSAYIQSEEGRKQIALGMKSAIETHFARRLVDLSASR